MNTSPIKKLLASEESFEKDRELMENATEWLNDLLAENESQAKELVVLKGRLEDLNLAISEWANQRGHGTLFFKELEIVLDQIKDRRAR